MRELDNIASDLFNKIRTRFDKVRLGDEKSKATTDPEKARFFNFDYVADGHKIGNITVSLIDDSSLKIYYSKNIVDKLKKLDHLEEDTPGNRAHEEAWYGFLRGLRKFAKRNLLSFDTRDITKSNLEIKDVKQQAKTDSVLDKNDLDINVTESRMFGTSRSSYQECGPVRIIVRHTGNVDDEKRGSRSRNIDSLFVETHQGERFLLPFKDLNGARAMAQHCSQGGRIEDEIGNSITNMVKEMDAMKHFVREVKRRQFEDRETDAMAKAAIRHYSNLKHKLHHIAGHRGYGHYVMNFESHVAADDDFDIDSLRERFVKKIYNDKFEAALPIVARAYRDQQMQTNNAAEQFESWADQMVEGAWALPDQEVEVQALDSIMAKPFAVGINAQNATGALYDIIGDDSLFDKLGEFADSQGQAADDADCRGVIIQWLRDNGYTELATKYSSATNYTQDQEPLQAQAQANQQDAAQQAAQAQGQGQVGSPGTAEPSPAVNPRMQESDLSWLRRLSGL